MEMFDLDLPIQEDNRLPLPPLTLKVGKLLFVLDANGSGGKQVTTGWKNIWAKALLSGIKDTYDSMAVVWKTGPHQTAILVIRAVKLVVAKYLMVNARLCNPIMTANTPVCLGYWQCLEFRDL